jgi:hypothetical protein
MREPSNAGFPAGDADRKGGATKGHERDNRPTKKDFTRRRMNNPTKVIRPQLHAPVGSLQGEPGTGRGVKVHSPVRGQGYQGYRKDFVDG